jgi:hypothetical protein
MIGIEFMARLFGKESNIFNDIIPTFIDELSNDNMSLAVSVALSLSTISNQIGMSSIEFIPRISKALIHLMNLTFEEIEESKKKVEMIQLSILSAMDVYFQKNVKFINPYLADIFLIMFHKNLVSSGNKKVKKKFIEF